MQNAKRFMLQLSLLLASTTLTSCDVRFAHPPDSPTANEVDRNLLIGTWIGFETSGEQGELRFEVEYSEANGLHATAISSVEGVIRTAPLEATYVNNAIVLSIKDTDRWTVMKANFVNNNERIEIRYVDMSSVESDIISGNLDGEVVALDRDEPQIYVYASSAELRRFLEEHPTVFHEYPDIVLDRMETSADLIPWQRLVSTVHRPYLVVMSLVTILLLALSSSGLDGHHHDFDHFGQLQHPLDTGCSNL